MNWKLDMLLTYLACTVTVGAMLLAVSNLITLGWQSYTDYLPFLPKTTRLFAAFPYSVMIFGGLALWSIKQYGWPGFFFVAFLNQLWEAVYDLTPAVFGVPVCSVYYSGTDYCITNAWFYNVRFPLYFMGAIGLALIGLAVILQFRGTVFRWKRLLVMLGIFWLFCLATFPWSSFAELLAELSFVALFFAIRVSKKRLPP